MVACRYKRIEFNFNALYKNLLLLLDMEFLFSFFNSTSHSFASLTTRAYVLFSISFFCRIFIDILILFFFFLHNFSFVFVILIDSFGFII